MSYFLILPGLSVALLDELDRLQFLSTVLISLTSDDAHVLTCHYMLLRNTDLWLADAWGSGDLSLRDTTLTHFFIDITLAL